MKGLGGLILFFLVCGLVGILVVVGGVELAKDAMQSRP